LEKANEFAASESVGLRRQFRSAWSTKVDLFAGCEFIRFLPTLHIHPSAPSLFFFIMGLFDFLSKKDAPTLPESEGAPLVPGGEVPASPTATPASFDEATRLLNDAAKHVGETIKPISDAARPLTDAARSQGKALVAEMSSAARDLGASLRTATTPHSSESAAPDAVSAPVSETPAASHGSESSGATSSFSPPLSSEVPSPVAPLPMEAQSVSSDYEEGAVAWPPSESVPFTHEPVAGTPVLETPSSIDVPATLDEEGNLEEFVEPLPLLAPTPLEEGATISLSTDAGTPVEISIIGSATPRGALNVYHAQTEDGGSVSLREAAQNSLAATRLERENSARRATGSPQIPVPLAFGTFDERVYLADSLDENDATFATQLSENAPLEDQISTLTQTSAALIQLHKAGFVHGALRPEAIVLGRPVRLRGWESLLPIGQKAEGAISFPGYGAPEIVAGEPLDARTDVYALGALLYRVVAGEGVPETGFDDSVFSPQILLPGVPQILAKTLGSPATRYSDMSALHRDLVRLRARVRPLARHESAGATTIGLESGRTTNQDAWGELRGQKEGEDGAAQWTAWVVSDGMGGMASGEVASQTAVAAILREAALWGAAFDGKLPPEAEQAALVKTWTREANRQAVEAMNAINARGGCTLVCGLVIDRRLTLAHVGDCRTYLLRAGELLQVTRDHSFVMSLVLQGEITKEQMRDHPDRSKITRSLGDRHPLPDYFVDGLEVELKTPSLDFQTGDILLAFSDGVWEPVLEDEMKAILLASHASISPLETAAHELIEAAMRAGGPDNATAYLLQMTESAPIVVKAN